MFTWLKKLLHKPAGDTLYMPGHAQPCLGCQQARQQIADGATHARCTICGDVWISGGRRTLGKRQPCPSPEKMGEFACRDKTQCWEPWATMFYRGAAT